MTIPQELPVNIIINSQSSKIKKLIQKAHQLKEIEATIHKLLPAHLQPQCRVIENKNNCITLGCESAAFAHQVKFLIPELLSKIRQQNYGSSIASINSCVMPVNQSIKQSNSVNSPTKRKQPAPHHTHSTEYKGQLIANSTHVTDKELKNALTTLHHTLKKN